MFLSKLNKAQRESFMALVTKMAMADGKVVVEEDSYLARLADLYGHDLNVPPQEVFGATNVTPFDTRGSQILTVIGMLAVAYADEKFHADESIVLQETVTAFGFSEDEVRHMKILARAEADISSEIDAFIG